MEIMDELKKEETLCVDSFPGLRQEWADPSLGLIHEWTDPPKSQPGTQARLGSEPNEST